VALGQYRDVEVRTQGGSDDGGDFFTVRFTEPDEAEQASHGWRSWLARSTTSQGWLVLTEHLL
jgi:hypothetical protein